MNLPRHAAPGVLAADTGVQFVLKCLQPRPGGGGPRMQEEPCPSQELHHAPTPPTCTPCTASSETASAPLPTLVGAIAPGDAERVALIANYYENVLSFLEAHHDGEEHLVFPLLRERCAGDERS